MIGEAGKAERIALEANPRTLRLSSILRMLISASRKRKGWDWALRMAAMGICCAGLFQRAETRCDQNDDNVERV